MDEELARHIQQVRRDRPLRVALWSSRRPTVRLVTGAFVLASACHLWLADAAAPAWLGADMIYVIGLALLCWRGAALGWLLSAVGVAIPLYFLRDQLTQSLLLLIISSTAGLALLVDGVRQTRAHPPPDPAPQHGVRHHDEGATPGFSPGEATLLRVVRGLTIATYLLAALHKLNRQFLDPQFSCAVYGVDELFRYWHLPVGVLPHAVLAVSPWLVLASETGIALLHLFGRRRPAWQLAVLFHIPLTLTMAPAFVFVMLVGHASFARAADLSRLRATLRRRGPILALAAAAVTGASLIAHHNVPEWTMIPREWLLWALFLTLASAFPIWGRDTWSRSTASGREARAPTSARWASGIIVALFVLDGLTPYLGVQYRHAAAMVSNLRIDHGCWNSVVFPESMRLTDDYIRVDTVYLGAPGRVPDYENTVRRQLWSPPQFRQMRRNWCRPQIRPFFLKGTYRGRPFVIEDLCADKPLPFDGAGIFGVEIFGDYLRFQKNLMRQCPQTCIH